MYWHHLVPICCVLRILFNVMYCQMLVKYLTVCWYLCKGGFEILLCLFVTMLNMFEIWYYNSYIDLMLLTYKNYYVLQCLDYSSWVLHGLLLLHLCPWWKCIGANQIQDELFMSTITIFFQVTYVWWVEIRHGLLTMLFTIF